MENVTGGEHLDAYVACPPAILRHSRWLHGGQEGMDMHGHFSCWTDSPDHRRRHGNGPALCRSSSTRGATAVVIWDRDAEALEATAAVLRSRGAAIYSYALDVSSLQEVARTAAATMSDAGLPDVVINNAGIVRGKYFWDHTEADIEAVMRINAESAPAASTTMPAQCSWPCRNFPSAGRAPAGWVRTTAGIPSTPSASCGRCFPKEPSWIPCTLPTRGTARPRRVSCAGCSSADQEALRQHGTGLVPGGARR